MLALGQAMGRAMGRVAVSELPAVGATDVVLTASPVGAAEEAIQRDHENDYDGLLGANGYDINSGRHEFVHVCYSAPLSPPCM